MRNKLAKIGFDFSNLGRQFRILENNNRHNFILQLRGYHAFVAPMSHLDHPTGIFEAIYMGVPGVMPIADYQRSFFPDWPWVIEPKDKAGLIGHLLWLRDHKEEAREMLQPWRERIRQHYNAKQNIGMLCDEIEQSARSHINRFKTSGAVIKFCQQLKGKSYTFDDIVAYLAKQGYMGISVGNMDVRTTFTYARAAVHHTMGLVGYVDTCEGPEETFMRRADFDKTFGAK
jgi:hypothetical protein